MRSHPQVQARCASRSVRPLRINSRTVIITVVRGSGLEGAGRIGSERLDAMKRRSGAAGRDVPRQSRGAHFDDEGGP